MYYRALQRGDKTISITCSKILSQSRLSRSCSPGNTVFVHSFVWVTGRGDARQPEGKKYLIKHTAVLPLAGGRLSPARPRSLRATTGTRSLSCSSRWRPSRPPAQCARRSPARRAALPAARFMWLRRRPARGPLARSPLLRAEIVPRRSSPILGVGAAGSASRAAARPKWRVVAPPWTTTRPASW